MALDTNTYAKIHKPTLKNGNMAYFELAHRQDFYSVFSTVSFPVDGYSNALNYQVSLQRLNASGGWDFVLSYTKVPVGYYKNSQSYQQSLYPINFEFANIGVKNTTMRIRVDLYDSVTKVHQTAVYSQTFIR